MRKLPDYPVEQFDQGVNARHSLVLVTEGAEGDHVEDDVSPILWNEEQLAVSDLLNLVAEYVVKSVRHGFF